MLAAECFVIVDVDTFFTPCHKITAELRLQGLLGEVDDAAVVTATRRRPRPAASDNAAPHL
jgi:hypothetical protein